MKSSSRTCQGTRATSPQPKSKTLPQIVKEFYDNKRGEFRVLRWLNPMRIWLGGLAGPCGRWVGDSIAIANIRCSIETFDCRRLRYTITPNNFIEGVMLHTRGTARKRVKEALNPKP